MNTESQADRITQLEAACAAMRDLLRDAQMHIEADNIDWARFQEGPDHDPNYKPKFPEIVGQLAAMREALENIMVHAVEFSNDWKKGDFKLCELASCDMRSLESQFENAYKALCTDAGKSLLDRLQSVEKERDRLRQACVGMVAWWNTPERDQPEKLPIRISDCEKALQPAKEQQ